MKQIKYIFLSAILCIAGIALVFQSCNNDNEVSSSDSASKEITNSQYVYLNLPNEFQQIGQIHNEGLDTVFLEANRALNLTYNKTKGNRQFMKKSLKSVDIDLIIKDGLQRYYKSKKILNAHYSQCEQIINMRTKISRVKGSDDSILDSKKITPVQKEFFEKIFSALANQDPNISIDELKLKLDEINKAAGRRLSKNEASYIYTASSVGFSSFQYWRKNFLKWAVMFANSGIGNNKCVDLCKRYTKKVRNSTRYKVPGIGVELNDGTWLAYEWLPELIVYPSSTWRDNILPVVNDDCRAAGESLLLVILEAEAVAAGTGGTAVALLPEFGVAFAIQIGVSSSYESMKSAWNMLCN